MQNKLFQFTRQSYQAEALHLRIIQLTKVLLHKITSFKALSTHQQNLLFSSQTCLYDHEIHINFQNSFSEADDIKFSYRNSWKSPLQLHCLEFYENYSCLLQKLNLLLWKLLDKKNIKYLNTDVRQSFIFQTLQFNIFIQYITKIISIENNIFTTIFQHNQLLTKIYKNLKKKQHHQVDIIFLQPFMLFKKQILVIIVHAAKLQKSSRFFNLIRYKGIWKDPFSFTSIKQSKQIEERLCKIDLSNLIQKYLNIKMKQLQICLSCEKMILFNKMDKHLKICKDRYDLEQYTQKLDAQINAKLQDVCSFIAKIKIIQNQRQKQAQKMAKQSNEGNKIRWQKSRQSFFKRQYKTNIDSRTYANEFEQDQQRGTSQNEQQSRVSRKPLRRIQELKNEQLAQYLKLIEQIKNVGYKIKNLKQSKKNELYQALKSIKQSTKPNINKLSVQSEQINHMLSLLIQRMQMLLKQRKYELQVKKASGNYNQNWSNFGNNQYETMNNYKQKKINKPIQSRLNKVKIQSQQFYSDQQYSPRSCNIQKNQMGLRDFKILKILGKGKYGEVFLVKKKKTGIKYALKKIYIENSRNYTQLENLKIQNNIFQIVRSPFIVKALYSFTEGDFHYFVMEYMPNGDFSELLERQQRLYQSQAKLCLAQLVLAIQHLHQNQIIHKDLKPQNIVIDANGHLKITDFGLSQSGLLKRKLQQQKNKKLSNFIINQLKKKQKSHKQEQKKISGSPYYMAPQVLNGDTITRMSDWWSFGIIVFQTLVGVPPFTGRNMHQIKQNIMKNDKWPAQIRFGSEDPEEMISYEAKDLIDKLLQINPNKRLGRDIDDLKYHEFFRGVQWDNLINTTSEILQLMQIKQVSDNQGYVTDQQIQKGNSIISCNQSIKFYRRDILCSQTLAQHQKTEFKYKNLNKFAKQLKNQLVQLD